MNVQKVGILGSAVVGRGLARTEATEKALREWCAANGIQVIENSHG